MKIYPPVLDLIACCSLLLPASAQCLDWSPGFTVPGPGLTGYPRAMLVFDDGSGAKLHVGGPTSAGDVPMRGVAAWDGAGWSVLGDLGQNCEVCALAIYDDGSGPALWVGGAQFTVGGILNHTLVKWLPGTGWVAPVDQPNFRVLCLATIDLGSGPALYAGGDFTSIGALSAVRVARLSGTSWSALGDGFTAATMTLCAHDLGGGPELYAGGYFGHSGTTLVGRLARWTGSGWALPTAGIVLGEAVLALESFDDGNGPRLYIGGEDMHIQSLGPSGFTLLTPDYNHVWDFAPYHDGTTPMLVAVGAFIYPGLKPDGHIKGWDGVQWRQFGLGLTPLTGSDFDKPRAVATYADALGTGLYVAGRFIEAGGHPAANFARWGIPCSPPSVVSQPQSVTAVFPNPVVFQVTAIGTGPLTYQWRHEGVPLTAAPGIEGWNTRTLSISSWDWELRGEYTCEVTGALGSALSAPAILTVPAGGMSGVPVQLTRVVLEGDPVPGVPGASFLSIGSSHQSLDGTVAFYSETTDASAGLYVYDGTAVSRVAVTGAQAPGLAPGVTFSGFLTSYGAAAQGAMAFSASLSGPLSTSRSCWYRDAQGLTLIARGGDQPAGAPAGTVFGTNHLSPRTGPTGHVVHTGNVLLNGVYQWKGIWGWTQAGGSALRMRTGQIAPGTNELFTNIDDIAGLTNGQGAAPIQADTAARFGLWLSTPSSLQPVILTGEALAGSLHNEIITQLAGQSVPVINEVGHIIKAVNTSGDAGYAGHALVRWTPGGLSTVLRRFDPAPGAGPGAYYSSFEAVGFNSAGALLVYAGLDGNEPYEGMWYVDPQGAPHVVAMRPPAVLPEIPPGLIYQRFDAGALDEQGRVLVCVEYTDAAAVFGWTLASGLFPIAVPGGQFEVAPGDVHTLRSGRLLEYPGGPSGQRLSSSFDSSGGLALILSFNDQTEGLYVGSFPQMQGLYIPPGESFCSGDGSATACPCANPGAPGYGCANSLFPDGALLSAQGAASITDDTLRLDASSMPNSTCLFFQGTGQIGAGNGSVFGDGLRCAGGTLMRFPNTTIADNSASFGHGVGTDPDVSVAGQVTAPGTRTYQVWYRNAAAYCTPATFKLTNGYVVAWDA